MEVLQMACDVMIILRKDKTEELKVDPLWWWPKEELKEDARFTLSKELGSYYDYVAKLTRADVLEMHQQFLPLATQKLYSDTGWQEKIQKQIKKLEKLLTKGNDETLFEVCVYEWESGY